MSLLDDVSIVVTPNGYKAGELYAVIPVPTEGSELVTDSDFLLTGTQAENTTGTYWTTGDSWSISGGNATLDGTQAGGSSLISNLFTVEAGRMYKVTVNVSSTSSGFRLYDTIGVVDYGLDVGENTFYRIPSSSTSSFNVTVLGLAGTTGEVSSVSVKEYTSADMDVTRATAATRVDEDGLVNYAEVIGGELAIRTVNANQAFFFNPYPNNTFTYDGGNTIITYVDSSGGAYAYFNSSYAIPTNLVIGITYKISITFKVNTGNVQFRLYNGVSSLFTEVTNSTSFITKTVYMTAQSVSGSFIKIDTMGSGQVVTISDLSVKEVTRANVPRIDYTGGGCPHILAEPMRTNLIPYSEDLTNSFYAAANMETITESAVLSPDGTTFGYTIVPDSTSANHYFNYDWNQLTVAIGIEISYSVYVKPNGNDFVQIATSSGFAAKYQNFELTGDGVIGTGDVNGKTIEKIGDWYKCSVTQTSTGANPRFLLIPSPTALATRNLIFTGNGTDGVLGWGVQIEVGSYPTSYIPNFGTALGVTRNQDIFTRDGIGSLINSREGVLFAEIAALANDGTNRIIALSDGTGNNLVRFYFSTSSSRVVAQVKAGGSTQVTFDITGITVTDFNKVALKYKENDFSIWINGTERGTDVIGTTPTGMNKLAFDDGAGSSNFFGKVRQLQVYKTALTDDTLALLTS